MKKNNYLFYRKRLNENRFFNFFSQTVLIFHAFNFNDYIMSYVT